MDQQNQQGQQQHPNQVYHAFYPPEDSNQDAASQYLNQHTAYSYLIPHNPVPGKHQFPVIAIQHRSHAISVVPSHVGLDLGHAAYQPVPQHLEPGALLHQQVLTPSNADLSSFDHHLPGLDTTPNGIHGANLSRSASANSSAPSPASSRSSLQMGHSIRYNPLASPAGSSRSGSSSRRRSVDDGIYSDDATDLMNDPDLGDAMSSNRKEHTRKLRIEAEQRRRDDLRDGYAKLRDVLPSKNLKGAKVAVLDRATSYIVQLETEIAAMKQRVDSMEDECGRLRHLNEMISMGLSTARIAGQQTVVHHLQATHTAPTAELGHMRLSDHGYAQTVAQQSQPHGIDPADIMPAPHGVHFRREDSFSPPTPSSSSDFST